MEIRDELRADGGMMLRAFVDDQDVGHLGWHVDSDGVWVYDAQWVDPAHRGPELDVANTLARHARARRGDAPWRAMEMTTSLGDRWMTRYIDSDYDGNDPRAGRDRG